MTHFATKATPIHNIDGNQKKLKKCTVQLMVKFT